MKDHSQCWIPATCTMYYVTVLNEGDVHTPDPHPPNIPWKVSAVYSKCLSMLGLPLRLHLVSVAYVASCLQCSGH